MNSIEPLSKLAKYGNVGVAICAIIALVITVGLLYNFAAKKMEDSTEVIRESIRVQQQLIDTVKRLDDTLSLPKVQANLRASFNGYKIVDELFPYEPDPLMTPATSSEEEWEDFDEPNL